MGAETGIAWTDHTFNPWWGCQRVSPGCTNCYAETWDKRFGPSHWGPTAERRFFGDKHWAEPLKWNRAAEEAGVRARVFCASMADVFEDRRDLDAPRAGLWATIMATPWLDWQLLTKRPENIARLYAPRFLRVAPANVWLGTTCEDQARADQRIPHLLATPAAVRFLSVEPMLGPVDLRIALGGNVRWNQHGDEIGRDSIHWVIVGGESGPGARPFHVEWARSLVAQCRAAGVPVFVKQLGAVPAIDEAGAPGSGKLLALRLKNKKGGDMAEWPSDLRVREFPEADHG